MNIFDELDRTRPEIPAILLSKTSEKQSFLEEKLDELWQEVIKEICDKDYARRSHHNLGTYDQGCRGPLCKKSQRERGRGRGPYGMPIQKHTPRVERALDPVLEYFHIVAKYRVHDYQVYLYERMIS